MEIGFIVSRLPMAFYWKKDEDRGLSVLVNNPTAARNPCPIIPNFTNPPPKTKAGSIYIILF